MNNLEVTLSELVTLLGAETDITQFDLRFANIMKYLEAGKGVCKSAFVINIWEGVRLAKAMTSEMETAGELLKAFRLELAKSEVMDSLQFRAHMRYGKLLIKLDQLKDELLEMEFYYWSKQVNGK